MDKKKNAIRRYYVSVDEDPAVPGDLEFRFVPKSPQQVRLPGKSPKAVPEYVVSVHNNGEPAFRWVKPPTNGEAKAAMEQIVRDRAAWIQRTHDLVKLVDRWAKELGWTTRKIEKKIEDSGLGNHKAAGLVMQEDAVRVLLDPISAFAPEADGLVDLYLMPGYDDIARLLHRHDGWQILYVFAGPGESADFAAAEFLPLSKKSFGKILNELKKHAE